MGTIEDHARLNLSPSTAGLSFNDRLIQFLSLTYVGTGSPEGSVTAIVGSEYVRLDGSAGAVRYIKESGSGDTGWAAVDTAGATGTDIPADGTYALTTTDVGKSRVTGDTEARFVWNADGLLGWGSGSAAVDTELYRAGADILKTNDRFEAIGDIYAGSGQAHRVKIGGQGPSAEAGIKFGSLDDVNLYRSSANVLKTDDAFVVSSSINALSDVVVRDGNAAQVKVGAYGPASEAGLVFGTALDTNLYRASANVLQTDDTFLAVLDIGTRWGSASQVAIGDVGSSKAGLLFGQTSDVNLFRDAADDLRTSDDFGAALEVRARVGGAGQVVMGNRGPGGEAGINFGSANDTNLYRSAANTLKTDDVFHSVGLIKASVGDLGQVWIGEVASDIPGIVFGSGDDTNLYRSSANRLTTDDNFTIALECQVLGALNHDGTTVGFFGATPVTQRTGPAAISAAPAVYTQAWGIEVQNAVNALRTALNAGGLGLVTTV